MQARALRVARTERAGPWGRQICSPVREGGGRDRPYPIEARRAGTAASRCAGPTGLRTEEKRPGNPGLTAWATNLPVLRTSVRRVPYATYSP